jgi:hypothetical protein
VPTEIPWKIPLAEPMVPTAVGVLTHVPPVGAPVRLVFDPTHVDDEPEIVGVALTVTIIVAAVPQPVA